MKNEILLRKLYSLKDWYNMEALEELIAEIKLEMTLEAAPKYKGNLYKAAAKFAKACHKEYADSRSDLAGAFMFEDGNGTMKQGICNGYVGVSYSIPIDGLMEIPSEVRPIDFARILPDWICSTAAIPSYSEIKKAYNMEKANKESLKWNHEIGRRPSFLIRIGNGQVVNVEYLMTTMEIAGMTDDSVRKINVYGEGRYAMLGFENEIDGNAIQAILMPVRVDSGMQYLIDMEMECDI